MKSRARALCITAVCLVAACKRSSSSEPSPAPSTSSSASTGAVASGSGSGSGSGWNHDAVSQASPNPSGGKPASVMLTGAVDGEALRKKNRERLSRVGKVTLLQGGTPFELGKRLCEDVVPQRPKETPVLLKPNIGGFDWFKDPSKGSGDDGVYGRTTDPEFVRGVIRCLRARGHQKITIAEGWGATHKDWEHLVNVSGYAAMAQEESVMLVAMDDDGVFDVELDQPGKPVAIKGMEKTGMPTLVMPKILAEHLDHGLYISLPKVKTHRFGVISMAIKGMQGTVMMGDGSPAFRQKARSHKELNALLKDSKEKKAQPDWRLAYVAALEAFSERMVDVLEIEAPDVVLAEGAPAMGGDGFQRLWPSKESVAIGGENPLAVDRVGAQILGLWNNPSLDRELLGHKTSPLIEAAMKRFGVDFASLDKVEVVGDGAPLLEVTRPVHYVSMAGFVLQSDGVPAPPIEPPPRKKPTLVVNDRKTVHAVSLGNETIAIDGKGDDAVWKRATEAVFDTDYAGEDTGIETRVKLAWSGESLYVLFSLTQAGLVVDEKYPVAEERKKLYEEDCVELFFTPDPQVPKHYYEIELGPFGHFFDLDVNRKSGKEDLDWTSEPKIAAVHDKSAHTATIEASFSAPAIVRVLKAGARLPLGLFRMEGIGKRSYLAWSPARTKKPNFHVPEAFGALILDP